MFTKFCSKSTVILAITVLTVCGAKVVAYDTPRPTTNSDSSTPSPMVWTVSTYLKSMEPSEVSPCRRLGFETADSAVKRSCDGAATVSTVSMADMAVTSSMMPSSTSNFLSSQEGCLGQKRATEIPLPRASPKKQLQNTQRHLQRLLQRSLGTESLLLQPPSEIRGALGRASRLGRLGGLVRVLWTLVPVRPLRPLRPLGLGPLRALRALGALRPLGPEAVPLAPLVPPSALCPV
mmetsp:Transcript_54648/g.119617  ORF Transcript_54648/g.119617 Transcript_54648/m.119617 type:complete len:235 (-) Transcript_54648:300-1004(-)